MKARTVYPTSLLPHARKKEAIINHYIEDLRAEASINITLNLMKEHRMSLKEVIILIKTPEYEDKIMEEMIRIHKQNKERKEMGSG